MVWCDVVWCAEGAVTRGQWLGYMSKCALCASVLLCSRDQCTVALGRCCSADACARSHRVSWAHCTCVLRCTISTLCVVLHCLVLCTALHFVCHATLYLWAMGSGSVAMHCHTACGQGAVELLQLSAALPVGSGQWKSCNALPHCLGAVGSGTATMHCQDCLRGAGSGTPAMHCHTAWGKWGSIAGTGQWNSCNALPRGLWAVGSGTPAMHCPGACGQWAVELLQCTASLPRGSGQWNSCNALPHCPGAVGSGNPAMHCHTAKGAVGSGTPAMHCQTAWGQWAVELLQCTATLPRGSGQWNSCNALPDCLGQWAVELDVVWRSVVWCGVVWCGAVWCDVVWCGDFGSM